MSCPNLIEDGNKNEKISTSMMNHHQDLIIENKAKKEKTKSRISYFTIIGSFSLLSMLTFVWLNPYMKGVTAGSESTAKGIKNRNIFLLSLFTFIFYLKQVVSVVQLFREL
jgi:hypothetical protein